MILPERVLGRLSPKRISSGLAMGPISLPTQLRRVSTISLRLGRIGGTCALQHHEGDDGFALDVVRTADHGGFRHQRVGDQRGFDLHRAQAVAGHVQHVVDASHDPEVAVVVAVRGVAGEVVAVQLLGEVAFLEAVGVAPDGADLRGERLLDDQRAACPPSTSLPVSSTTATSMPGSGRVQEPGLIGTAPGSGAIMWQPVSVCHQVSTMGQRAWPMTL